MSTPATTTAVHQDALIAHGAANTPVKSPARRVLGELTPNTRIVPPNLNHGAEKHEALKSRSPLKQVQTLSPARPLNAENLSEFTISGIGRKRSINEVDGAVAREEHRGYTPRRHDERETILRDTFRPTSMANMRGHTSPSMMDLQDDDLSSTDVDSPEPQGNVSQETSATKASFSSLIDYNPQGSSQASQRASSSPEIPESISEPSIKSQAEILRLRLRIALYKVRTNQTNIPLSELALPTPHPDTEPPSVVSPSRPSIPSITISSTSPSSSHTAPATTVPKLLPAPVLLPTAYSSRHITEPYLPSSPPDSGPQERVGVTSFATPVAQRRATEQLSSPPESEERNANAPLYVRRRDERFEDADLTSSVVKGRAASGLLELMHAT